jgi:hypothetical protein
MHFLQSAVLSTLLWSIICFQHAVLGTVILTTQHCITYVAFSCRPNRTKFGTLPIRMSFIHHCICHQCIFTQKSFCDAYSNSVHMLMFGAEASFFWHFMKKWMSVAHLIIYTLTYSKISLWGNVNWMSTNVERCCWPWYHAWLSTCPVVLLHDGRYLSWPWSYVTCWVSYSLVQYAPFILIT